MRVKRLPVPQQLEHLSLAIDTLKQAANSAFDAGAMADLCGLETQNFYVLRCDINARVEMLKAHKLRLERED
jgi:hypothetical protein